jgi:hypothetical protein
MIGWTAVTLGLLAWAAAPAAAQDDKAKLREGLKDTAVSSDWIYDDLDAGFAAAKKSDKPLLVVFRCVP